ncbi:MAG: protein kinase [Micrococcales bacterium]|nr:protein kinase [Micrococcales bacterium]MCL2668209.1 protein kinase [Micrococcales bacterium]
MLSGEVLSRWLQRREGTILRGSAVRLSRSGLLRVSTVDDSRPVRVRLPVRYGGQAAVARGELVDGPDTQLALRVQAVTSREEQARQMERLLSMLAVVTAAREHPQTYPSVLPVVESFVSTVPGAELGLAEDEHELWCDVMVWCPANLSEVVEVEGDAARAPDVVVTRMAPVVATVLAVHENLGVIHRDITPHNVLVDDAGQLLLADWGIAHLIAADKTSTHTQRLGNLGFSVPPETLRGDTAVGRYTDAWYLGSLLVWMLTGHAPDADYPGDWLPPGLDTVGDRLATIARGLCRLDPHTRMRLPEATGRLDELVSQHGPVLPAQPVPPLAQGLRTSEPPAMAASDGDLVGAPAPDPPSAPLSGPAGAGPAPTSSPVAADVREADVPQRLVPNLGYPPLPPDELVQAASPAPASPAPAGPTPASPGPAAAGPAPVGPAPAGSGPSGDRAQVARGADIGAPGYPGGRPPAVPGGPSPYPNGYPSGVWAAAPPGSGQPVPSGQVGPAPHVGGQPGAPGGAPANVAGPAPGAPVGSPASPPAPPKVVGPGAEQPSGAYRVAGRRVAGSGGQRAEEQSRVVSSEPRVVTSGPDGRRVAGPVGSQAGPGEKHPGSHPSDQPGYTVPYQPRRLADQPGYTVPYQPRPLADQPGYTVPYQPQRPADRAAQHVGPSVPPPAPPPPRRRGRVVVAVVVVLVVLGLLAGGAVAVFQIVG